MPRHNRESKEKIYIYYIWIISKPALNIFITRIKYNVSFLRMYILDYIYIFKIIGI